MHGLLRISHFWRFEWAAIFSHLTKTKIFFFQRVGYACTFPTSPPLPSLVQPSRRYAPRQAGKSVERDHNPRRRCNYFRSLRSLQLVISRAKRERPCPICSVDGGDGVESRDRKGQIDGKKRACLRKTGKSDLGYYNGEN